MANLKEIRRRIASVEGTQKITSAMKMVAAAKLRKAQDAAERFRDYSRITSDILAEVADDHSGEPHPLFEQRDGDKMLILVISSDKGLCGGFNTNLNRLVMSTVAASDVSPDLSVVGKKAKAFYDYNKVPLQRYYDGVLEHLDYTRAAHIAAHLQGLYADGTYDRIVLAYSRMESVISQVPLLEPLLPVLPPTKDADADSRNDGFIYEPAKEELLAVLLPRYVEVKVYGALLESVAAEHSARMTAMETATNNADDMISSLTLVYNRARQSAITNELMDIVGGAEALND